MKVGAMRVLAVVALVGVLAAGFAVKAGAAENWWPEGYCAADGTPVVTYWPPGWEGNWKTVCDDGVIKYMHETVLTPVIAPAGPREQPPDFGRWVGILFNDKWMTNPYNDVYPFLVKSSGRTLIPLRYVSEAIGASVEWDAPSRTAAIGWQGRQIVVTIGDRMAHVDGRAFELDQPPIIWKDRTMIPLRFIVEAFGATVVWNNASSDVVVTLPGVVCAPTYCQE